MRSKLSGVVIWLIPILLIVLAGLISLYVPSLVNGWKAQGLKEAPVLWQFVIDFSDFIKLRWFLWLPVYIIVAVMPRRRVRASVAS